MRKARFDISKKAVGTIVGPRLQGLTSFYSFVSLKKASLNVVKYFGLIRRGLKGSLFL